MQYEEIIEIIQSKRRFGKAYGRDVTAEMMELLDHPEADMKIIHRISLKWFILPEPMEKDQRQHL